MAEGLMLLGIGLYILPAAIALLRKKRNAEAILVLDLLLGWTIIGWIVALIWSLTWDDPKTAQPSRQQHD